MTDKPQFFFRPVEGALLDLESLQAISAATDSLLAAELAVSWPGAAGLILEGMEIEGAWSPAGPPGAKVPDTNSRGVTVSPGAAIITAQNGRRYLLRLDAPLYAAWPTQAGPSVRAVLVLLPQIVPASLDGSVAVAREQIKAQLGFARPEEANQPFLLPVASSVGNGTWATDLQRVWQPEHAAILQILKKLERLEQTVWRAEPEGSVWERQVLGRNWVRYQTVAASALQAARICLISRAMNTKDRVRLLGGLYEQLNASVERAGNELLQIIGPGESAGPYAVIGAQTMRG